VPECHPEYALCGAKLIRHVLEHFSKKNSDSCEHGYTLLGPDQNARGLAQSKTLARMDMAIKNAKRLELRWPATAFSQDVSPQQFSVNKIAL
jgi:hypothetical protein